MDKWLALQGHANDVFSPTKASLRPVKGKMAVRTMRNQSILFIDCNVLRYHLPGHLAKTVFAQFRSRERSRIKLRHERVTTS